jgi:hypothetical protein
MPQCPGTHTRVTSLRLASAESASRHSTTSLEVTFGLLSALSAAWLSTTDFRAGKGNECLF